MSLGGHEGLLSAVKQLFTQTHPIDAGFCRLLSNLGGREIHSSVLGVCEYDAHAMTRIVSRSSGDANVANLYDTSSTNA